MYKKNILFLTVNFPPNPTVGTRRISKILKYLNHEKYRISVLTLSEKYYNLSQANQTGDWQKIPDGVRVYRTDMHELTSVFTKVKALFKNKKQKDAKKNSQRTDFYPLTHNASSQSSLKKYIKTVISRMRGFIFAFLEFPDKYIGWAGKAIRAGVKIINDEQIDIIFTTAPPHSVFLIASILKKSTGVKLIVDFRDPWALASWINSGWLKKYIRNKMERYVVNNADMLIFVTEKLLNTYRKHYNHIDEDKFKLFSNGFDPDDFKLDTIQHTHLKRDHIKIVHLGTLYKKRNPMPFIQAVEQLLKEEPTDNILFQVEFIGTLTQRFSSLPTEIKNRSLDEIIRFIPSISFEESIRTMYNSDILLLIQPETLMQIPAKLFEYMYTRRPIFAIAEPESATEQIIADGKLGITAISGNVNDIKAKLRLMFQYIEKHPKPNDAFINTFNYVNYIKTFEQFIDLV